MKKHSILILILSASIFCFIENGHAKNNQNDSTEQWRTTFSASSDCCFPAYNTIYPWNVTRLNLANVHTVFRRPYWYFIFPPSGRQRTVEGARVLIVDSDNGIYGPGQVLVSLKVFTLQGEYISTASSQVLNLKNLPLLQWVELPMSLNDMDRAVHQNEMLAFEIRYTDYATSTGDFHVSISFEVDMESFESGDKSKFRIGEDVIIGGSN